LFNQIGIGFDREDRSTVVVCVIVVSVVAQALLAAFLGAKNASQFGSRIRARQLFILRTSSAPRMAMSFAPGSPALNTKPMLHSIIQGDACFTRFSKMRGTFSAT
jgi:hypothetical protein